MPFNSAGLNASAFNAALNVGAAPVNIINILAASIAVPSLSASSHTLNHVDIRTYTNVIGVAVAGFAPLGGAVPFVDIGTALPNTIARYISNPDSRIGYGSIGIAKIAGTVIAGETISASAILPSIAADGTYLAMGSGYASAILPSVSATAYGAATASAILPNVSTTAFSSVTSHIDSQVSLPKVSTASSWLVGSNISAASHVRVVTSSTGDFPAVATASVVLPRIRTKAGYFQNGNMSAAISIPLLTAKAYGAARVFAPLPLMSSVANSLTGQVMSAVNAVTVRATSKVVVDGVISVTANVRVATAAHILRGVALVGSFSTMRITSSASALSGNLLSSSYNIPVTSNSTLLVGNSLVGLAGIRAASSAYTITIIGATTWRCVNLHNGAVTNWNIPAEYIGGQGGTAAIATTTGVAIAGTSQDAGALIQYNAVTGLDDFSTSHMKRIVDIWLGGRGLTSVSITTDNNLRRVLTGGISLSGAVERRIKVPRGIKTRYVQVGVTGNAPASLHSISLEPEVLSRRVR